MGSERRPDRQGFYRPGSEFKQFTVPMWPFSMGHHLCPRFMSHHLCLGLSSHDAESETEF